MSSLSPAANNRKDIPALIVEYWWNRRWFIFRVSALSFSLFAILVFLLPKKYKAEATIAVLPPRFQSEVRTEPLSVTTVKNLLFTGELIQQIIDIIAQAKPVVDTLYQSNAEKGVVKSFTDLTPEEIAARYSLPPEAVLTLFLANLSFSEIEAIHGLDPREIADWTIDDLSQALESEETVEKKTASDIKFSPLLNIYAIADTGPKSQLIANTWAFLFERKYDSISGQKTRVQHDSIEKQQKRSQKELEALQLAVLEYKSKNNIEVYLKHIEEYSKALTDFTRQLELKRNALRNEFARRRELFRIVAAMEQDGEWLGRARVYSEITTESASSQSGSVDSERHGDADQPILPVPPASNVVTDEQVPGSLISAGDIQSTSNNENQLIPTLEGQNAQVFYETINDKTIESRQRLEGAMHESNMFYQKYPIELMERERDQMQKNYIESLNRYTEGKVRTAVLKASLESIDEQLSQTQPLVVLNTGIAQDNIAEAIIDRRENIEALANVQFQSDQLNPVWVTLMTDRNKLGQELELITNEVQELEKELPGKHEDIFTLQNGLYQARMAETFIKENLERWQQTNQSLFDAYVEANNSIFDTSRQIGLLQAEVKELDESTSRARTKVDEYQTLYNESATKLQLYDTQQRALQRNVDLLLQKLQEAKIAVSEDVSDISIAASAVTPARHYFPPRTILVLVLTLITVSVLLGLLARARYMELLST